MAPIPSARNFTSVLGLIIIVVGCAKQNTTSSTPANCAAPSLSVIAGNSGSAEVFLPDPIIKSGNPNLSPTYLHLDDYRTSVALSHLGGRGVLEGQFVAIHDGVNCLGGFGAFDPKNQFTYSHSDFRFQEVMAYYYGDQYRAALSSTGYLTPADPVIIDAHCGKMDNAYFIRYRDAANNLVQQVCLGDSVATAGASYADDAVVTVHELEHATTVDTYSMTQELNQFLYDEAGSLNEAISDFMALSYLAPEIPKPFDPEEFSRWALGTFIPQQKGTRGSHKCPEYDADYPNCGNYPNFSVASTSHPTPAYNSNTNSADVISYVYPDGLGWPYADNFTGTNKAQSAFKTYSAQEEIHNAGILMEGALWDVYDALKTTHGGDAATADTLATQLVLEALKHLPKPNPGTLQSPVTFREFATQLVDAAGPGLLNFSSADLNAVEQALTNRGLYGGPSITSTSWADVGPGAPNSAGTIPTPGMRILDDPAQVKVWLINLGLSPTDVPQLVPQGVDTGLNGQLDPGELVAIWFDILNKDPLTAGNLQITVTSLDPSYVEFLDFSGQYLALTDHVQVQYGKVNGSNIVSALAPADAKAAVATSTTYFKSDPFFDQSSRTALFIKVDPSASGNLVHFKVDITPSNGVESVVTFQAQVNKAK